MTSKLLPCPFCGEPGEERDEKGWFACSNNDCAVWHIQALEEDWNKRAAPEAPRQDPLYYVGDIDGYGCLYSEPAIGALVLYRHQAETGAGIAVFPGPATADQMSDDEEHKAFEKWWRATMNTTEMDLHRNIYPMNSGWSYSCHETNRSWITWQARAEIFKQAES